MALFYKLCYIRLDCGTLNGGSVFYLIIDSDVNGSFLDDFQWTDDEWWIFLFSRIEWTVSVAQTCSKIFRIFFSIQIYNVCFQLMFMTVISQVYYDSKDSPNELHIISRVQNVFFILDFQYLLWIILQSRWLIFSSLFFLGHSVFLSLFPLKLPL